MARNTLTNRLQNLINGVWAEMGGGERDKPEIYKTGGCLNCDIRTRRASMGDLEAEKVAEQMAAVIATLASAQGMIAQFQKRYDGTYFATRVQVSFKRDRGIPASQAVTESPNYSGLQGFGGNNNGSLSCFGLQGFSQDDRRALCAAVGVKGHPLAW